MQVWVVVFGSCGRRWDRGVRLCALQMCSRTRLLGLYELVQVRVSVPHIVGAARCANSGCAFGLPLSLCGRSGSC